MGKGIREKMKLGQGELEKGKGRAAKSGTPGSPGEETKAGCKCGIVTHVTSASASCDNFSSTQSTQTS